MIKIREEGPDFSKWPGATATIRIKARAATEHMDENGIQTVWVKPTLDAYATFPRGPRCPISDEDAKRQLKNHPPGTLIDMHTGQTVNLSPRAKQKLFNAIEKAVEKNGEQESGKSNPV